MEDGSDVSGQVVGGVGLRVDRCVEDESEVSGRVVGGIGFKVDHYKGEMEAVLWNWLVVWSLSFCVEFCGFGSTPA